MGFCWYEDVLNAMAAYSGSIDQFVLKVVNSVDPGANTNVEFEEDYFGLKVNEEYLLCDCQIL